jgi:hypothetical protein
VQDLGFAPEPRARRTSRRLTGAVWLLVCSLFVVFGIATGWEVSPSTIGVHAKMPE